MEKARAGQARLLPENGIWNMENEGRPDIFGASAARKAAEWVGGGIKAQRSTLVWFLMGLASTIHLVLVSLSAQHVRPVIRVICVQFPISEI